jgi:hypothetical protein
MASMILGWSEPKFIKQCVTPASQRASKKAKEAVYMLNDVGYREEVDGRKEVVNAAIPISKGQL